MWFDALNHIGRTGQYLLVVIFSAPAGFANFPQNHKDFCPADFFPIGRFFMAFAIIDVSKNNFSLLVQH
ncbi:MAG: hypothetical protein EX271_10880 [Acidimicrobiales bacterium]|nr:MAG: hypothetical protein EX271_10880 [Acidimicrobiales bacterium]